MEERDKNLIIRILILIKERFPLPAFLPLILVFFAANGMFAAKSIESTFAYLSKSSIIGSIITLLIFFHLRIFDEIKDLETDKLAHPERPLARGLISVKEAKIIGITVLLLELIGASLISLQSLSALLLVIFYSILMYKEFFISEWLQPRLIIYALVHAPVSPLISLFIFSTVTGIEPWAIPAAFAIFLTATYFVSNVFEFSRKTFLREEEEEHRDSYSKIMGTAGAGWLVLGYITSAVILTSLAAMKLDNIPAFFYQLLGIVLGISFFSSLFLSIKKNSKAVKLFRLNGSIFILLYNAVIIIGVYFSGKSF